jgi:hypothetical protein
MQGSRLQVALQHMSLKSLNHHKEIAANGILGLREKPASLLYRTYARLLKRLCTQNQGCTQSHPSCTKKSLPCTNNPATFLRISTPFFVQPFPRPKNHLKTGFFGQSGICPQSCTKKPSGKSPFPGKFHRTKTLHSPDEDFSTFSIHFERSSSRLGGTNL